MRKPKHHLFFCASARATGKLEGTCKKRDAMDLLSYAQSEVKDRMLDEVEVAMTGCLNVCGRGPVIIDYPGGYFYERADQALVDEILDAIEDGGVCERALIED